MEIFNGAKEVVAPAHDYCIAAGGYFNSYRRWFGCSSVCLYSLLVKIKLNREKELEVMLTICVGVLIVYFATGQQYRWLIAIAIVLGVVGAFSKFLTAKIARSWIKLGEAMGFVMSKVILTIIFFGFLFPLAVLSRLFNRGQDALQLKRKTLGTYYHERHHTYSAKDLENTW